MKPPVLEAMNLSKHYPVHKGILNRQIGAVQAVSDVNFRLTEGETLAIVGESGCGKSTLGRALLRLSEPTAGNVLLDGKDITTLPPGQLRDKRREMQMVFQDPFGSLNPRMTVRETLLEPIILHKVATGATAEAMVSDLLKTVGLSDFHAGRYPHEFSGGQRQRICIARALATKPRIIVCDEPVSALDVSVQAQIVNLLQDLQRQFGLSYVFISHDLAVVRHIADRVAVMYLGRIVEMGDAETIFRDPRHPYTRALVAAAPKPVPGAALPDRAVKGDMPSALNPPSGCAFHTRCPIARDICSKDRPELRETAGKQVACHFPDEAATIPASVAAPMSNVLQQRLAVLDRRRAAQG